MPYSRVGVMVANKRHKGVLPKMEQATVTRQYRAWCGSCLWQGPERLVAQEASADAAEHNEAAH